MDYKYINLIGLSVGELAEEVTKQNIKIPDSLEYNDTNKTTLVKILQNEFNQRQPIDFTAPVRKLVRPVYDLEYLIDISILSNKSFSSSPTNYIPNKYNNESPQNQWESLASLCRLPSNEKPVQIIKKLAYYDLVNNNDLKYILHESFEDIYNLTEYELSKELSKRNLPSNISRFKAITELINFGSSNAYELLSDEQLKIIAKERGINLSFRNDRSAIIQKINQSDEKDFQWLQMCSKLSLTSKLDGKHDEIDEMSPGMLFFYMAYNWLQVNRIKLEERTLDNIRTIARISLRCGFLKERPKIRTLPNIPINLFVKTDYQFWKDECNKKKYEECDIESNNDTYIECCNEFTNYKEYEGDENLLSIMDIYNIIEKGYYINPDFISKYFNTDQIIEMYKYPVESNDINYLLFMDNELLNQCLSILNIDPRAQPLLKYNEIVFTLSRRYLPYFKVDQKRYFDLYKLNDDQLDILRRLEDIKEEERFNLIAMLSRTNENRMEMEIRKLQQDNVREIANNLGMIIPNNMEAMAYFRNNIYQYKTANDRSPTLKLNNFNELIKLSKSQLLDTLNVYKDDEIFKTFNAIWYYNGRNNLISKAYDVLHCKNNFFILNNSQNRKCYNKATAVMYAPISHDKLLVIGYGNLTTPCLGFELTDIQVSFEVGEDGDFKFRIPVPEQKLLDSQFFAINEVNELKSLLLQYGKSEYISEFDEIELVDTVLEKINAGLAAGIEANEEAIEIRKLYNNYDNNVKNLVKEVFIKLFEIGMYARRWKGEGYPYPLMASQTNEPITVTELYDRFSLSLSRFQDELNKLPDDVQNWMYDLKTYRIINGNLQRLNRSTLKEILRKIGETYSQNGSRSNNPDEDAGCFRLGSVILIGTAYYYLRLLCHYQISNFDEFRIDNIS